jgi:FkbM family methyltransferase
MEFIKPALKRGFPRTYNRVREWKYTLTSHIFSPHTVKHTYGGHEFEVYIADPLARGWYDHHWNQLDEIDMFGANGLRGGCLVFDLGAHQNVVAMMWAKALGPSGTVISVEASRHNVEIGRRNVSLNGFTNIITLHAAVAETEGELLFSQTLNGSVSIDEGEFLTKPVRAVTIDGLVKEFGSPDVLFLDIEGYEISALRGAPETLKTQASWFIEMHGNATLSKYGSQNTDVLDFFEDRYDYYYRTDEKGSFVRLERKDAIPASRFFFAAVPRR